MTDETFDKLVNHVGVIQNVGMSFLGLGEPLLHPNFLEFVEKCKERKASVGFSTNGTMIDEEMAGELVRLGVNTITFSVDGIGETYESIRKGSDFDLVMENIKRLHLLKNGKKLEKPQLTLTFVGLTENIEQFPLVMETLSPFIVQARFNHVVPYSSEIADLHLFKMPKDKVEQVFNQAQKIADKHNIALRLRPLEPQPDKVCQEPWVSPYIAPDGTVYPCCILGDHHGLKFTEYFEDGSVSYDLEQYAMGNVMEQDLDEIWNNGKFVEFRSRLKRMFMKTDGRRRTVKEYMEIRNNKPEFFCDQCSFRWGCVC